MSYISPEKTLHKFCHREFTSYFEPLLQKAFYKLCEEDRKKKNRENLEIPDKI